MHFLNEVASALCEGLQVTNFSSIATVPSAFKNLVVPLCPCISHRSMSGGRQDELLGSTPQSIDVTPQSKRARISPNTSPPRVFSDAAAFGDLVASMSKTPRDTVPSAGSVNATRDRISYPTKSPAAPKRPIPPRFEEDYELGEKLSEGAEGQAFICYKFQRFQGGNKVVFRERKFVVKQMKLNDLKLKNSAWTWEKLLEIKRGQSEVMMANAHRHIVRHLVSYENEEAQELYVSRRTRYCCRTS